ncbi:MAG: methylated-DNA--[protein]-cysteine S-methyltransferase [Gemmatimonadota bacterium]|nr:methylated-DNA--[protein]-cysteine S-methyltransferase [Gemmatimonadota bacterium]
MMTHELPPRDRMLRAFTDRDASFEGVFYTAVLTTGIFCRPTCSARKPRPENVEFYATSRDALLAGYRPCRRCRPLRPAGESPEWLQPVIDAVDQRPTRRWRDADLKALGVDPTRVRRWFQQNHGMTFHAYSRARRLGSAMGRIQEGRQVSRTAFETGYESLSGFGEALKQLAGSAPTAVDAAIVTVTRIPTPLGPLVAGVTDGAIVLLEYADRRMLPTQFKRLSRALRCVFVPGEHPLLTELASQLEAYFAGRRAEFDLPLRTSGTDFQERVWAALREIPAGTTQSYGDVARTIGQPTAVRAVARANGDNRIAILIPCHRVIGSDGKLTGYGGGLWRKKRLLEIEAAAVQTELV